MGWEIGIHRESRIPLAEQIAVQLAEALRDPAAGPRGERLPSAGWLAARLGVHRETARRAYRMLGNEGLVRVVPGSGVFRGSGPSPPSSSREDESTPFRRFLDAERTAGRSGRQTAELLGEWLEGAACGRVLVAAPEGVLTLVAAELRRALPGIDVRPLLPSGWSGGRDGEMRGMRFRGPVAATPEVLERAARSVSPAAEIVPLRYAAWRGVRRLLLKAPAGSLVAVASACAGVERRVRALAAGLRGTALGVAAVRPEGGRRAERVLRLARIVLADVLCEDSLDGPAGPRSVLPIRLVAPGSAAVVARRLTGRRPPRVAPSARRDVRA